MVKKKTKPPVSHKFDLLSIEQFSKLGMIFWVGGTITIGTVIIPLLFKALDQITAATLTGQILNINAYIGIIALIFAFFDTILHYKLTIFTVRKFWYIIAMELILVVNYFAIFPIIASLRVKLADVAHSVIHTTPSFNFWHSLSAVLFIITSILGVLYIIEKH